MGQLNLTKYNNRDGISGFLFFIFLAVPGLRHMYLGLMKRGVQFLVSFFGIITLAVFALFIPALLIAGGIYIIARVNKKIES